MKPIEFIYHSKERMSERGATEKEVIKTLENGVEVKAELGRLAKELVFDFNNNWMGKIYQQKKKIDHVFYFF